MVYKRAVTVAILPLGLLNGAVSPQNTAGRMPSHGSGSRGRHEAVLTRRAL